LLIPEIIQDIAMIIKTILHSTVQLVWSVQIDVINLLSAICCHSLYYNIIY